MTYSALNRLGNMSWGRRARSTSQEGIGGNLLTALLPAMPLCRHTALTMQELRGLQYGKTRRIAEGHQGLEAVGEQGSVVGGSVLAVSHDHIGRGDRSDSKESAARVARLCTDELNKTQHRRWLERRPLAQSPPGLTVHTCSSLAESVEQVTFRNAPMGGDVAAALRGSSRAGREGQRQVAASRTRETRLAQGSLRRWRCRSDASAY